MVVYGRLEIASTAPENSVYKGRLSCTEFSIEFSCVTQYKSCSSVPP